MKAVLITFSQTVRVIIEGEEPTEEEYQNAFIKCQEVMQENGPGDTHELTEDDINCPYGECEEITPRYVVNVGNIGNIECSTLEDAKNTFEEYKRQSINNYGRAAGESVYLIENGEPIKEYIGTHDPETE